VNARLDPAIPGVVTTDLAIRFLDLVGEILIGLDLEGRITMVNQRACDLLGAPREQLLGLDWFTTFLSADQTPEVRAVFEAILRGDFPPDEIHTYENSIIRSDGLKLRVAWRNTYLRDIDGTIIGTLSSGQDVTTTRLSEAEWKLSERRFRVLVDTSPDPIFLFSPQGHLEWANHAAEELWGIPLDELQGCQARSLASLVDSSEPAVLRELLETGSWRGELETFDAAGQPRRLLVVARQFCSHDEAILSYLAFAHDLTAVRTATLSLEQTLELQHGLSNLTSLMILGLELRFGEYARWSGRILRAEQACYLEMGEGPLASPRLHHGDISASQADDLAVRILALFEKSSTTSIHGQPILGGEGELGLPVNLDGRCLGLLGLRFSSREAAYKAGGMEVATTITELMSVALARKRTEEELTYRFRIEQAISEISKLLMTGSTFSSSNLPWQEVVRILGEALQVGEFFLWEFEPGSTKLRACVKHQLREVPIKDTRPETKFNFERCTWCYERLRSGKDVVLIGSLSLPAEAVAERELLPVGGSGSYLFLPINHPPGTLWGVLGGFESHYSRSWNQYEINALHIICEQLSSTLVHTTSEARLRELEHLLRAEKKVLEEKNITLKEVLRNIESEKQEDLARVSRTISLSILPLLERLGTIGTTMERRYLEIVKNALSELTVAPSDAQANLYLSLSPKEAEVCNLIANGMDVKECAHLLHLSPATVATHRRKIRHKLGLVNSKTSLTTFLRRHLGEEQK